MKKATSLLLAALLALSLAACSDSDEPDNTGVTDPESSQTTSPNESASEQVQAPDPAPSSTPEEPAPSDDVPSADEPSAQEPSDEAPGTDLLVAYFSYAENAELPDNVDASSSASIQLWNGSTTGNTGVIASMIADATGADVFSIVTVDKYPDTYDATLDQAQDERSAGARPELASHIEDLDRYSVVFLGFPNWWGDMPMAVYSFLDEVDLSSKTIVPFVTSGGSGFSGAIGTIEGLEPDASVQDGLSVSGSSATAAQEQVQTWLRDLGYIE